MDKQQIFLDSLLEDKEAVLSFISKKAKQQGVVEDEEMLFSDFLSREKEYPTAVQPGIAIPHAKSDAVKEAKLYFVRLKKEINWESPDDFNAKAIFAILVPKNEAGSTHIKILSALAVKLLEEDFQEEVFSVKDEEAMLTLLNLEEEGVDQV
ncbi:PTS sugar transporter subunit IIA [Marinilactibacillus kalidii]|uniref:PTS sugar transporter subunit IIA n=1 Tax=Marinilactibacillus kalidii TaxID=2820274 RepID=UPI001ABE4B5A|nr:fructose PTS transporter subunit IIA [Marinilactibacillus kalidii]